MMIRPMRAVEPCENKAGNVREELSRNNCCRGKAISIIYSECVGVYVALVIQHSRRM
jgi:hypothetical protein